MTTKPTPAEALLSAYEASRYTIDGWTASKLAEVTIDAWCAQLGVDRETAERVLRDAAADAPRPCERCCYQHKPGCRHYKYGCSAGCDC